MNHASSIQYMNNNSLKQTKKQSAFIYFACWMKNHLIVENGFYVCGQKNVNNYTITLLLFITVKYEKFL